MVEFIFKNRNFVSNTIDYSKNYLNVPPFLLINETWEKWKKLFINIIFYLIQNFIIHPSLNLIHPFIVRFRKTLLLMFQTHLVVYNSCFFLSTFTSSSVINHSTSNKSWTCLWLDRYHNTFIHAEAILLLYFPLSLFSVEPIA